MKNRIYTDEELLNAVSQTFGNLVEAAKLLGCDRTTFYARAQVNPGFKAELDKTRNAARSLKVEEVDRIFTDAILTGVLTTEYDQVNEHNQPTGKKLYKQTELPVNVRMDMLNKYRLQNASMLGLETGKINGQLGIHQLPPPVPVDMLTDQELNLKTGCTI